MYAKTFFHLNAKNIDISEIKEFCSENSITLVDILPGLQNKENSVMSIDVKTQFVNPFSDGEKLYRCDWISDITVRDAFNEGTVVYSKTLSGQQSGAAQNIAKQNAAAALAKETEEEIINFFKSFSKN